MARIALLFGCAALLAAALPSPGLYLAVGLGISAIGTGVVAFGRRASPGGLRLAGAAAITIGAMGFVLGAVRIAVALAAIDRIGRLLG